MTSASLQLWPRLARRDVGGDEGGETMSLGGGEDERLSFAPPFILNVT